MLPGSKNSGPKKDFHLIPFMLSERIRWLWQTHPDGFFKGIMDLTLHDVMDYIAGGAYGKIDKNRLYAYLSKTAYHHRPWRPRYDCVS